MKHVLLTFVMLFVSLLAIGQNNLRELSQMPKDEQGRFPYWRCATVEVTNAMRAQNPKLPSDEQFESFVAQAIRLRKQMRATATTEEVLYIPVVVHVIHGGEETGVGSNISLAQIESQIEVLNEDFRRMEGTNGYNEHPDGADTRIEFVLAERDPEGNILTEPGVDRVRDTDLGVSGAVTSDQVNNYIKPATYWDPERYLNMWTVTFEGGLLGYAQFPINSGLDGLDFDGYPSGAETDGVVMWYRVFGSIEKGNFDLYPGYNKGRTTTHEIGHFLGLRHIWGDGGCGYDDFCSDTPESDGPNYGCPTGHASCGTTDMIENYMDYSGDDCMNIFTQDQKDRMMAVLEYSPRRGTLLTSDAITRDDEANFYVDSDTIYEGQQVAFTNSSQGDFTNWSWAFEGGTPGSSNDISPTVTYNTAGQYDVTLTATYDTVSRTESKVDYITVIAPETTPVVDFEANKTSIFFGDSVTFADLSSSSAYRWTWTFEGGRPATSTERNPMVVYDSTGSYNVTLTATNAQGESTLTKEGYVQVFAGPEASVTPSELSLSLDYGQVANQTLTISNNGDTTLTYFLDATGLLPVSTTSRQSQLIDFGGYLPKKGEKDQRVGHPITARNGEGAGYFWMDSKSSNGPVFNWIDIQSVGTNINLGDDGSQMVALPFEFEFFNENKSEIYIGANGILTFNSNGAGRYHNTQIPYSSTPNDMIAAYWTDLYPSGRIHYYGTAEYFIVQFTDVPRLSGNSSLTFQYILYPNGDIKLQYLDIQDSYQDLTVGVENATGTEGMQIAFNTEFAEDSLAVHIYKDLPVLFSSDSGEIAGGASATIDVSVSAEHLFDGAYEGSIAVRTNDVNNASIDVPLTVNVTGYPELAVSDSLIDFGSIRTESDSVYRVVNVANTGGKALNVEFDLNNTYFSYSGSQSVTIQPQESYPLMLGFSPDSARAYSDTLRLYSDDANNDTLAIAIQGNGIIGPKVELTPEALQADLLFGEDTTLMLAIYNTGDSTLNYSLQSTELVFNQNSATLKAGNEREGEGPENYTWVDSKSLYGPAFEWIDISDSGQNIDLADNDYLQVVLPFSFDFFGETKEQVYISANGFLTFNSYNASSYSNYSIPYSYGPNDLIAAYWTNLYPSNRVHYLSTEDYFIVQFTGVPRNGGAGNLTFQYILYPNGDIKLQYLDISDNSSDLTIGIENSTGYEGMEIAHYSSTFVEDSLAIMINRNNPLTLSSTSGTLEAGDSANVEINVSAARLFGGSYSADIQVNTNDSRNESILVPLSVNVTGQPEIAVADTAVYFGTTLVNNDSLVSYIELANIGSETLTVQASVDHPAFGLLAQDLLINPEETQTIGVYFAPDSVGDYTANLSLISNSVSNDTLFISLQGNAQLGPQAEIYPGAINAELFYQEDTTHALHIVNTGDSTLHYWIQTTDLVSTSSSPSQQSTSSETMSTLEVPEYTWADSRAESGPAFEWVDIDSVEQDIYIGNNNYYRLNLPFAFEFYGQLKNYVYVSSNGILAFNGSYAYSSNNTPIPSTSGPENLIAAYWTNLDVDYGDITYYSSSEYFIVQYDSVSRYGGSGNFSFQVILYPGGQIKIQYLEVEDSYNDVTIGIENAYGNEGLELAYDSPFAEDSLAVMFYPNNPVELSSYAGSVQAGDTAQIDVLVSAEYLLGGSYSSNILVQTNDPRNESTTVPLNVEVTGFPELEVSDTVLSFQAVAANNQEVSQTISLMNPGSDILNVQFMTDDPAFSINDSSISIEPMDSFDLPVYFNPDSVKSYTANLILTSNATSDDTVYIALEGQGMGGPIAGVSPGELYADLLYGEQTSRSLTITNTGDYSMNYSLQAGAFVSDTATTASKQNKYIDFGGYLPKKGELDTRVGHPVTQRSGSGDGDYYWVDSRSENGPQFDWTDIQNIGTLLSLSDDSYRTVSLPFDFEFFETAKQTAYVGSNGFIAFNSSGASSLSNTQLPASSTPNDLIAAYWTDLNPSYGQVHYFGTQEYFIVQFTNVRRYGGSGSFTFQYILYPNGYIKLQYLEVTDSRQDLTVGIENAEGDAGMQIAFNTTYAEDSLAVMILNNSVVDFSTYSGTIAPGSSEQVEVTISAENLQGGTYNGTIELISDDPDNGLIEIPVTVDVTGFAELTVNDTILSFDPVYAGDEQSKLLTVSNPGNLELNVELSMNQATYSVSEQSFTLQPGGMRELMVTFRPETAGEYVEEITMISNALENDTLTVELNGLAVTPPTVNFSDDQLHHAAYTGETSETYPLTFENQGDSVLYLNFAMAAQSNAGARKSGKKVQPGFYAESPLNQTSQVIPLPEEHHSLKAGASANESFVQSSTGMTWVNQDTLYAINYSENSIYAYHEESQTSVYRFSLSTTYSSNHYSLTYDGELLWTSAVGSDIAEGYTLNGELVATFYIPGMSPYKSLSWDGEAFIVRDALGSGDIYRMTADGTTLSTFNQAFNYSFYQLVASGNTLWAIRSIASENYEVQLTKMEIANDELIVKDTFIISNWAQGSVYSIALDQAGKLWFADFYGNLFLTQYGENASVPAWLNMELPEGTVAIAPGSSYTLDIGFNALDTLSVGNYEAGIFVATNDSNNPSLEIPLSMEILNSAPVAVKELSDQFLQSGDTVSVSLTDLFTDADNHSFSLTASANRTEVATIALQEEQLTLYAASAGRTIVNVIATDELGAEGAVSFEIVVNEAPVITGTLDDMIMTVGESASLNLATIITDSEDGSLVFEVSVDDATIAEVHLEGSVYTVNALSEGQATVTVTASDQSGGTLTIEHMVTVEGVLSTDAARLTELSAYPNPVSGKLTVNLAHVNAGEVRYSIYEMSGRRVKEGHWIQTNESAQHIDLSDLKAGVYLMTVTTAEQQHTIKLMKK